MKKEIEFVDALKPLLQAFVDQETPRESDSELADAILNLILERERLRHRVSAKSAQAREIDALTLKRMTSWDSDDPSMSTVEKAFKRIAKGRGSDAVALLKSAAKQKMLALSKAQSERALLPRPNRRQPMSLLVEQILLKDLSISESRLFYAICRQLKDMADPPYSYSLETFKAKNPKHLDIPRTGLSQYLYRGKKKLSP